jgi:hypothetical protein
MAYSRVLVDRGSVLRAAQWYCRLNLHPSLLDDCMWCLWIVPELSTLRLSRPIEPIGIASTPCGLLLVTCVATTSLYSLDPSTGELKVVVQAKHSSSREQEFSNPACITLAPNECCAYVTDRGDHSVHRVTLPKNWFMKRVASD